jgi:hypothetical protein
MNKYATEDVVILLDLIKKDTATDTFEDENTRAHIYQLSSGKFVLLPALGKKGLLIEDKETLDHILKTRIPIEDDIGPFEKKQEEITALPGSAESLLKHLANELKIEVALDNDDAYYKEIDSAIKRYGYQRFYDSLFVEFGVFVGEKLRIKYDLNWHLKKKYKINPFFEPYLTGNKQELISPFYKLSGMLLEKKKFHFKDYFDSVLWFVRANEINKSNR